MTNAISSLPRVFIFDLHWESSHFSRFEETYPINRWEVILPVVLYSLTSKRNQYPIALFYSALTEIENVIDTLFRRDGFEHLDPERKDDLRSEIICDVQLLGAKLAYKTQPLLPYVDESFNIRDVKLIGRSLYVTVQGNTLH